jgi:hypothetical protein
MGPPLRRLMRRNRSIRVMKPVRIADDLEGLAGKWVAVKDGKVVEAGNTPDAVGMKLRSKQIRGATIFRVPAEGEPELVGIG